MAGKIKQVSELEFKTKGAKKVQAETEQVGKGVTRLGQTSASAGRQFSAQANGLGGLVAAYAGAAANVFALQQAFAALQSAAQFEQIIAGTNTLANAVGSSGEVILKKVQQITNSQITLAEAARSTNIALSAGFNQEQIEGLTQVSLKASRALGRDLNDAIVRLTRGTAKLEPELLDELGIFTRIAPATEAYAASVGKSASQLTEFERRQAFVNAAIEEGERKFGKVNTTIPTTAEKFEALKASVLDLATQIGSFIAEKLVPLADFFTNNIAARLALFGFLLRQIGSVAIGLFAAQATKAFAGVGAGVERLVGRIAKLGPTLEEQRSKLSGIGAGLGGKDFNLGRLSKSGKETISPLVKDARDKKLGVIGANQLSKALEKERKQLIENRKALLAKANAAKAAGRSTKALTKALQANKAAMTQTRVAAKLVKTELGGLTGVSGKLVPVIARLGTVYRGLGKATRFAAKGLNIFALAITALVAGGASVAALFNKTQELNQIMQALGQTMGAIFGQGASEEAKKAAAAITGNIVAQDAFIKSIGNTSRVAETLGQKFISNVTSESVSKTINEVAADAFAAIRKGKGAAQAAKDAGDFVVGSVFGTKALIGVDKKFADNLREVTAKAIAAVANDPNLNLIQAIIERTGAAGVDVQKQFVDLGTARLPENMGETGKRTGGSGVQFEFTEGGLINNDNLSRLDTSFKVTEDIGVAFARINDQQRQFNEGSLSVVQSQSAVKTINEDIEKIEAAITKQLKGQDGFLQQTYDKYLKILKVNAKILTGQNERKIALDAELKSTRSVFSAEIKAAQNLQIYRKEDGSMIMNANDLRAAQLRRQQEIFELGKKELHLMRTNKKAFEGLDDAEKDAAKAALVAEQVLTGARIKSLQLIQKTNEELTKREQGLSNQIATKELSNQLKTLQQELAVRKSIVALQKSQNDLAAQATEHAREAIDAMREMNRFRADQGGRNLQTILDSQAGALFSPGERNQIQIQVETKNLERFIQDQRELQARARDDQKTQLANLAQERKDLEAIRKKEDEVFAKQAEIAQKQADIAEANSKLETELMQKRFEAIQKQAKIFDQHVEGMARVIASAEIARETATGDITPSQRKIMLALRTTEIAGTSDRNLAGKTDMSNLVKLQEALNKLRGEEAKINNSAREQFTRDITRKIEDNELTKKEEEAKQKLANTVAQANLEIAEATDAFNQLTKAAAINADKGLTVAIAGLESFAENAKTSLNSMFTAIREGTLTVENFKQGFKDFIFNIVEDIQASITEEFIVKPLKESLAGGIKDLFGIGGETKGADNAKVDADGNLHVVEKGGSSVVNSAEAAINESGETLKKTADNTAFSFSGMFEKMKQSTNPLISLFGSLGSVVTQAISGLGSFASSLLQGITGVGGSGAASGFGSSIVKGFGSLFGQGGVDLFTVGSSAGSPFFAPPGIFASGGYVRKMAAGGMMRDRVPAMLEPGEFVMQRKAVNRIGADNLSAMNGSGGMPNISVEVKNEGTPKDAQASVKPQVDVNKMVVEIVTRDIRNNGPIRKTLRTGAE